MDVLIIHEGFVLIFSHVLLLFQGVIYAQKFSFFVPKFVWFDKNKYETTTTTTTCGVLRLKKLDQLHPFCAIDA